MKNKTKTAIILISYLALLQTLQAQISKVEPPFWWSGMKSMELQLMFYGENIAGSSIELSYEGVSLRSVTSLENPNYLFVDLSLRPDVQPGKFTISLFKR